MATYEGCMFHICSKGIHLPHCNVSQDILKVLFLYNSIFFMIQLHGLVRVLLEKLIVTQVVNKFFAYYEANMLITVFIRAQHQVPQPYLLMEPSPSWEAAHSFIHFINFP
jgi:hypothetical protein